MGALGPLWVLFGPLWAPSGLPLGASGSIWAVRRILLLYKDLKHFQQCGCSHGSLGLFRAVLDPSRWPRGSVGRPSFARTWYRVSSFFCKRRLFSTTSFFQPPGGGSKGGPGAILEHFWDPPEAQNGPLEGPLSAPSTPHTYFYVISVYLFTVQVDCRDFFRWT